MRRDERQILVGLIRAGQALSYASEEVRKNLESDGITPESELG